MDIKSFEELVIPIQESLFRSAVRLLKNKSEARDMVQEVIIKMWINREKIHSYNNIETYGLHIIRNQCLDQLRSMQSKLASLDGVEPKAHDTPYRKMESKDQMLLVETLLAQLPVDDRMIIELRSLEQKSISEIAFIMGLTENHIRVKLSRIRKKIRKNFDHLSSYGT